MCNSSTEKLINEPRFLDQPSTIEHDDHSTIRYRQPIENTNSSVQEANNPYKNKSAATSYISKQAKSIKAETVKMTVNKYYHPAQIIPTNLNPSLAKQLIQDDSLVINYRIEDKMNDIDNYLVKIIAGEQGVTRVMRFQKEYLPESGCDSEEEDSLTQKMFFQDLKGLRKLIAASMMDCFKGQVQAEKDIAKQSNFFMAKIDQMEKSRDDLEKQIRNLQYSLINERDQNLSILVSDQVESLCLRAYFSYENQQKQQAPTTIINEVVVQPQQQQLAQSQPQTESQLVADLKWQMECESKSLKQCIQVLEGKLSAVMARMILTEKENKVEKQNKDTYKEMIKKLQDEVKSLSSQLGTAKEQIDQQQFKIIELEETPVFDETITQLQDELQSLKSELAFKTQQVLDYQSDNQTLFEQLKILAKQTKIQCDRQNELQAKLDVYVQDVINSSNQKLSKAQQVFNKMLKYSRGAHYVTVINQQTEEYDKLLEKLQTSEKKLQSIQGYSILSDSPFKPLGVQSSKLNRFKTQKHITIHSQQQLSEIKIPSSVQLSQSQGPQELDQNDNDSGDDQLQVMPTIGQLEIPFSPNNSQPILSKSSSSETLIKSIRNVRHESNDNFEVGEAEIAKLIIQKAHKQRDLLLRGKQGGFRRSYEYRNASTFKADAPNKKVEKFQNMLI